MTKGLILSAFQQC